MGSIQARVGHPASPPGDNRLCVPTLGLQGKDRVRAGMLVRRGGTGSYGESIDQDIEDALKSKVSKFRRLLPPFRQFALSRQILVHEACDRSTQ